MTGCGDDHSILVVDDEPAVADMAAVILEGEGTVSTAYGGAEALDALESSPDIVLLDRRMPVVSGDEVLSRIREDEIDCRVIVLSAVSPDYDILELPFDDYLCKPIAGEPLKNAVEQQVETLGDDTLREYVALTAKRELLEATKPTYELDQHAAYQALLDRVEAVGDRLAEEAGSDAYEPLDADIERV